MTRFLVLLVVVASAALGAALAFFNQNVVHFNYLVGETDWPLIVLMIVELVIVVICTLLACGARLMSLKAELRRTRRQLRDVENELKTLRNLPLNENA